MPRPGPRPYECVRRAWHSDRHQPIRGSLIQEIFRVVNEIHTSATKKNKEWQEMLPIVVLKAEEILYSKASSETEYMNFSTLRDRLVDAINTIIRLDDSTETGEFLQPCIEAALNLACTPRRASRSQRNNNSTSYLSSRNQESPILSPSEGAVTNSRYLPYFWSMGKPVASNFNTENFPAALSQHTVVGNCLPLNKSSIYPLYYGSDINGEIVENTSACDTMAATGIIQNDARYSLENECSKECDLALRLGPLTASSRSSSENKTRPCAFKDVGSRNSEKDMKSNDFSYQMETKLPLFPTVNPTEWSFENGCVEVEAKMRKRKADFSHSLSERRLPWLPKLPFGRFIG